MMRPPALHFVFTLAALLALTQSRTRAQTAPAPPSSTTQPAPAAAQLDALIHDLASPDPQTRDAADQKLRNIAWPAVPALISARHLNNDAEQVPRIRAILNDIVMHHTTGVSAQDAELFDGLGLNPTVSELFRLLNPAQRDRYTFISTELQILDGVRPSFSPDFRAKTVVDQYLPELQAAQAWDEMEWALLTATCMSHEFPPTTTFTPQLLRLAHQRGNGPALIQALMQLRDSQGKYSNLADMILQLARATGDDKLLLQTCDQLGSGGRPYLLLYLADHGQWKQIAALPDVDDHGLVVRAAALKFDGQAAAADALLTYRGKPLEQNVVNVSGFHPAYLGKMDLAFQLFAQSQDFMDAIRLAIWCRRYSQALSLIDQAVHAGDQQAEAARSLMAPEFARLNEPLRAQALIKNLSGPQDQYNSGWVTPNLQAACCLLNDDATLQSLHQPLQVRDVFFPKREAEAAIWIAALKAARTGEASAVHATLRMLNGTASPHELAALAPHIAPLPVSPQSRQTGDAQGLALRAYSALPLAYVEYLAGRKKDADDSLKDAATILLPTSLSSVSPYSGFAFEPESPIHRLLTLKDWHFVQPLLEALGSNPAADPVFLFLQGLCRERLGDPTGRNLQTRAAEAVAVDPDRCIFLGQVLLDAGEPDLAVTFAQDAIDDSAPWTPQQRDGQQLAAQIEQRRGHYAEALNHWRQCMLVRFHYFQMPDDTAIYLRIPRNSAYCQAMIAIQGNNRSDLPALAAQLPALDPEDLSLTLPLIAALTAKGWAPEARALADAARAPLNAILKDFPNSHLHYFLLAQIDLAINDRSAAQTHLTRALQLDPQNPDYLALQSHLGTP